MPSLKERTRLSRALNDIDIRIHSNLGADDVLQAALDGFVEALDADAGDIKLIEGDGWVVRYVRGFDPAEVGRVLSKTDAPVAERVARTGEPVVISDFLAQDDVPYVGFPSRHDLRATLAVPLVERGEIVGGLSAWMHGPREYTEAEVGFARRMAASVALALSNARLYESERDARRRAESAEKQLESELARTRVLLKASDELTSTTDKDDLFSRLARVVLDATGIDRVFVNEIDMTKGVLIPKVPRRGLVAPRGASIPLGALSLTAFQAIQRRKTALLDYEVDELPERDREIAKANDARLVLFVPLLHQGEMVGHISLDQPGDRYEFTPEQIRTVESIAAIAGVALQNARLFEREHRIAETLQQALIAPPEDIDSIEIATVYQPSSMIDRVGGDFFDVFDLGEGKVALVVGDVSGKGVRAAQLTALMRDGVRAYLIESADPALCFRRLNALAHRFTPTGKFATVFLGVLDRVTGVLEYSNGGHPAPVVVGRDDVRLLESRSAMLGAFADVEYTSDRETLEPGEILVVVTDGVTEARHGTRMFGEAGLIETLERLRETSVCDLPEALLAEVTEFAAGRLHDDVVVLCASRLDDAVAEEPPN